MKPRHLLTYSILALVWGLSFLMVVHVVSAFGWAGTVTLRALAAGGSLWVIAWLTQRKLDFSCGWLPLAITGFTTVMMQLAAIAYAAPKIGTAMTAIIVSAVPLFSMLVARIVGLEQLHARSIVGLFMGFIGIVLLVGFPEEALTPTFLLSCGISILGSFSAACGSIYVSTKLRKTDPWVVTIGSFLWGGIMTLPLLLFVPLPTVPGAVDVLWLLALGLITSALMYVLFYGLMAAIGPTKAISVEFVVTVVAVVAGTTLLGERLSWLQVIGAVVIITGCALVLGIGPGGWRRAKGS